METINRLGSFGSILKMIPGMGGALRQIGDAYVRNGFTGWKQKIAAKLVGRV